MPKILVSYRRDDSRADAGRLCDHLTEHFGRDQVFFDIDSIAPGDDFVSRLEKTVSTCDVLIAVIGPRWLLISDQAGARRLDDPQDFVRLEIASALRREIPVFPVLVDNARIPRSEDLPDDLQALTRHQAVHLPQAGYRLHVNVLIQAIEERQKTEAELRKAQVEAGWGDASAVTRLGTMYESGSGGFPKDESKAVGRRKGVGSLFS